jgi:hypothetical protein
MPSHRDPGFNMPRQYRLVAGVVEAMQLTPDQVSAAALWCGGMEVDEIDPFDSTKKFVGLNVPTLSANGVERASQGDYIVKNLRGEFSVVKPNEFETTYEPI